MKNIKLIFKNLCYLIKTRKVFFTLMCMGQIVSLCVVLILTGAVQVNLSEENLEWYGDLSAFSVSFNDEDNISVEKWKSVTEKLKKYLKDEFYSMCMEGKCPEEELRIQTLYPGEKFHFIMGVMADKDYEEMIEELLPLALDFKTVTVESPRWGVPSPRRSQSDPICPHEIVMVS